MPKCSLCGRNLVGQMGEMCPECQRLLGVSARPSTQPSPQPTPFSPQPQRPPIPVVPTHGTPPVPKSSTPPPVQPSPTVLPPFHQAQSEFVAPFPSAEPALASPSGCVEGVIKNYQCYNEPAGFLRRWFRSLVGGAPFPWDNWCTRFNVQPDGMDPNGFSGTYMTSVVFYGQPLHGSLSNNLRVRAIGRRNRHGDLVAREVQNLSNGTRISGGGALPSMVVRLLTAALALAIGYLFVYPPTPSWTLNPNIPMPSQDDLLMIIAVVVGFVMLLSFLRRRPMLVMKLILGAVFLVSIYVAPQVASLILSVAAIWWLLRVMFR